MSGRRWIMIWPFTSEGKFSDSAMASEYSWSNLNQKGFTISNLNSASDFAFAQVSRVFLSEAMILYRQFSKLHPLCYRMLAAIVVMATGRAFLR